MSELEKAAYKYATRRTTADDFPVYNEESEISDAFVEGAQWQKEQMMENAIGDYWIARDKNVFRPLNIYEDIPERVHLDDGRQFWMAFHHSVNLPSEIFDEIQWENEPQKVKLIIIKEGEK